MKLNLLYYKNILDLSFSRFFKDYGDYFTKIDDKYVLSNDFNYAHLKKTFTRYITDEIKTITDGCDKDDCFLLIGACFPKNNILLRFRDKNYFPQKFVDIIEANPELKYKLVETDIIVNISRLNAIVVEIFNGFYKNRNKLVNLIGYNNIFLIQHANLDCYSMYKIIKNLYGKTNCINIHKEKLSSEHVNIVALNEIICKYINNKRELLKSSDFKLITEEIHAVVEGYITECFK